MPKAALHNLGCKVNAYETEAMQQQLEERGYEIVPFDQKADVYIINTCSVTNIADRKSRQMLHRAKKLNPEAVVVAAGCYVQVASDALKEDDSVDIIVGNNNKARLADILEEYMKDRQGDEGGYVLDIARDARMGRQGESYGIPGHLSRSRTAATSSAATALSPMPEAGSEAGSRRMWRLRLKGWWPVGTGKWCLLESI